MASNNCSQSGFDSILILMFSCASGAAGNSLESSLVAVVVPVMDKLRAAVQEPNATPEELCRDPVTKNKVLQSLTSTAKAGKLKGFELVRAVYLESEPFSVDNELLTPTFKLKRPQLQKKYQKEIDAMYTQIKAGGISMML